MLQHQAWVSRLPLMSGVSMPGPCILIICDDPFWRPGFVSTDCVSRPNSKSIHVCQLKFSGSQSIRDRIAKASMYARFQEASAMELPPSLPIW